MEKLEDKELFQLVNEISQTVFHKPFKHHVIFNYRLRTTGGRYIPNKKTIELNPKYAKEMQDEFIGIIKHELCHYHLHIEGKGYKHRDQEFKELLKKTNSPRYCKPLPSMKREYKHLYKCIKCNQIYKRMRKIDTKKYSCGKCRGKITLLS